MSYCVIVSTADTGRLGPPAAKVAKSSKPKLFIADGRETPLKGVCLVFTRMPTGKDTSVTEQNMIKVSQNMREVSQYMREVSQNITIMILIDMRKVSQNMRKVNNNTI